MPWREWLPHWQLSEKLFLISLASLAAAYATRQPLWMLLLAMFATGIFFSWAFVKWARTQLRRFIWNLRNRLLVAFLFIAVIPLLLVVAMVCYGAKEMAGQVAVYLVHAEMERRLGQLRVNAEGLVSAPPEALGRILERIGTINEERFPGVRITVRDGARVLRFPPSSAEPEPEDGVAEAHGLIVRDEVLHGWARASKGERRVTIVAPLTRRFFTALAPGLGEVSILHFQDPGAAAAGMRRNIRFAPPANAADDEMDTQSKVPPPVNRFDFDLLWGTRVPVHFWERPGVEETALLGVHSRMSQVAGVIFSQKTESGILPLLYGIGVVLVIVEFVSIVIGITITTTITRAVAGLYEGTQKVMRGDFSHRIPVQGDEQIGDLTRSFNRMTENVERLLAVAKENERIQAELKIAREVQSQLFPKAAPRAEHLEIYAVCEAARSVSGDYYDYQALPGGRIALALADVAGKGISAALLMASLQSNLRVILREQGERASAAQTVTHINEQLYANTAPEKYATFFLGIFDEQSSELSYTNAGHLPPVLVRGGEARILEVTGTIVGAFPFARYGESRIVMQPGDLLVCYTDGVTETENEYGEMFGEERLKEALVRYAGLPPDQLVPHLVEDIRKFTGSPELQDDLTLLVARRV